jgi:hypothetical protein
LAWSERPGWSPLRVSLAVAGLSGGAFFAAEAWLGRIALAVREPHVAGDIQVAIGLILLLAYFPGAFAGSVRAAERTLRDLAPSFVRRSEAAEEAASVWGRRETARLWRVGCVGVAVGLLIPFATNLTVATWFLWELPPEAIAHRLALGPLGWFAARSGLVVWRESWRLAHLATRALRVDLLDLRPLAPLSRAGVRHGLVGAGALSLLLVGFSGPTVAPGLPFVVAVASFANLALSATALWRAVKGGHEAIQREKARALEAANVAIRGLQRPGASHAPGALADALAWKRFVAEAPDWPIDFPTLQRFVVPLALPLASLLIGAFLQVLLERLIPG